MNTQKRRLFHFASSPYSRRTRLALAHKKLDAELCEARQNPKYLEEARQRTPLRTIPVLLEADGHTLGDSTAISHYLDRTYADAPALWHAGHAGFEIATLVDVALNALIDLGTRYYPLRGDPKWGEVKGEMMARAQSALDALGERAKGMGSTVSAAGWSAPEMWLFTATTWLETLPLRAPTNANVAQILSLGASLPEALSRWADAHRKRTDVIRLDA
jgi:glutathione S-transferase